MVLTTTITTDQALKIMYDNDEILDTEQTMPWFDRNYVATNPDEVSFITHATITQ